MEARAEHHPHSAHFLCALAGLACAGLAACTAPPAAGSACTLDGGAGGFTSSCYPVSCTSGFRLPACNSDSDCGTGSRCVRFEYLTGVMGRCMKKCTTDADCGRPGLLACDVGYHVCSDYQGLFLSDVGTFGGHRAGGGACRTGRPPARSELFSANVAASDPYATSASEVSLAVDPTTTPPTIYAAYNALFYARCFECRHGGGQWVIDSEIARSEDRGVTWTPQLFQDPDNIGDPALAVDHQSGELYYAYIGGAGVCRAGNSMVSGNQIHLVWSTDHGDTFHGPVVVNTGAYAHSPDVFMDKPQAVVGPQGDVYVTFDAAPVKVDPKAPSNIVLAYSTDHGKTFTDVRVNGASRAGRNDAQPAVDDAGDLWVIWQSPAVPGGESAARSGYIRIAESTNRGHTFGPSKIVDPGDEAADWPNAIAVSPDGTKVYVAYQSRTPGKIDVFDVKVAYSLDGGDTWKPPVKVNDDATCATHWLPGIGLGPKGDVWVVWYDNRYGDERVFGAEGRLTGGALSFGKNFAVTDGNVGPFSTGRANEAAISDYLGFATSGSLAVAGWADLRGTGTPYASHVYTSVATLPR